MTFINEETSFVDEDPVTELKLQRAASANKVNDSKVGALMWLYRQCWLFLKSGPRKAQCLFSVTVSLSFPISSRADHTIISPLFLSSHILTPFSLLSSPPYHLLSCQPPYCPLLPHFAASMLSFKALSSPLVVSFSSSNIMPVLQSVLVSTRKGPFYLFICKSVFSVILQAELNIIACSVQSFDILPSFMNLDTNMVLNSTKQSRIHWAIYWRLFHKPASYSFHPFGDKSVVSLAFRTEAWITTLKFFGGFFRSPNPNYSLFSFLNLNFSSDTPSGPLTVSKSPPKEGTVPFCLFNPEPLADASVLIQLLANKKPCSFNSVLMFLL